jgi:hypothetical protein
MRTPGCGIALVAWTAVETPSKLFESHALPLTLGALDVRFARAWTVAACGGAWMIGDEPGGGVPVAMLAGGSFGVDDGPITTVRSAVADDTPITVLGCALGAPPGGDGGTTIVASFGVRIEPLPSAGLRGSPMVPTMPGVVGRAGGALGSFARGNVPLVSVGFALPGSAECPNRVLSSLISGSFETTLVGHTRRVALPKRRSIVNDVFMGVCSSCACKLAYMCAVRDGNRWRSRSRLM